MDGLVDLGAHDSAGFVAGGTGADGTDPTWTYLGTTNPTGAANPEAVWQFSDAETYNDLADLTGNGHTLALVVGTRKKGYANGLVCEAFDGVAYLRVPNASLGALNTVGALTIEVLFLPSLVSHGVIVSCADVAYTKEPYAFEVNDGLYWTYELRHRSAAGAGQSFAPGAPPIGGNLHYVVMTRAADGKTVTLYHDGALVASTTLGVVPGPIAGAVLTIGMRPNGLIPLYGAIACVRITTEAFTAAQVLEVYGTNWSG